MPKKLAVMTVGVLHEPWGHPRVQGFVDRVGHVFASASASEGFVDRSDRNLETLEHTWGPIITPECFGEVNPGQAPSTLSIWDDIESVMAFAYHGAHGEAMGKRKEWFQSHDFPTFVFYWIEEGEGMTWTDAAKRLDYMNAHGPTPHAFNSKSLFDPEGNLYALDTAAMRAKAAANPPFTAV